MHAALLVGILLAGFAVYSLFREYIFDSVDMEPFQPFQPSGGVLGGSVPAVAPLLIRQAPVYPEREISPSGPSPPSQEANPDEVVVYGPPQATDPYQENHESSMIPENLRHPERSYRPTPSQEHTSLAVQAGIASPVSSGPSMSTEMIQNGGEFMSGVFANDNFDVSAFSSF